MQDERFEMERAQFRADPTRPMKAITVLPTADVDQEILEVRGRNDAPFFRQPPRGGVRSDRNRFCFRRVHVRRESGDGFAEIADRLRIVGPRRRARETDEEREQKTGQSGSGRWKNAAELHDVNVGDDRRWWMKCKNRRDISANETEARENLFRRGIPVTFGSRARLR